MEFCPKTAVYVVKMNARIRPIAVAFVIHMKKFVACLIALTTKTVVLTATFIVPIKPIGELSAP